jgi:hypothetical protein
VGWTTTVSVLDDDRQWQHDKRQLLDDERQ